MSKVPAPTVRKLRPSHERLQGPRQHVRRLGPRKRDTLKDERAVYVDGKLLTLPETKVYRALLTLGETVIARMKIGPARELGSGEADFFLPARGIIIEYQGPFHATTEGRSRDFYRRATRKQFGAIDVIPIYESDLDNLYVVLKRLLGRPLGNSLARSSY